MAAALLAALGGGGLASVSAMAAPISFVTVTGPPGGQPMPPGFLGVSLEYSAVHLYTGRDPAAVNPVFVQLLKNMAPGQTPVVRIGGNSADQSWWPMPGVIPPPGVKYGLTDGWLRTTRAFADALRGQLILDLNLAGGRPALAATEARALIHGIGREHIQAFEVGNEADLYTRIPWYYNGHRKPMYARPSSYSVADFIREFTSWRAAAGQIPIAGPAFADLSWMSQFDQFLAAQPGLGLATFHRYPLRGCSIGPSSPRYATIANLMADYSTVGQAQTVAPYVAMAHARGVRFRLDEINSVACGGSRGVSDTFASALWVLDTMFEMAKVGVDGINIHTFPGAAYDLFTFTHRRGVWRAFVHPEYYGLLMFSQADPPGARLLPVSGSGGPVKVWATQAPNGTRRFVLINTDATSGHSVQLSAGLGNSRATIDWLRAPNIAATTDVVLGGQTFGTQTDTGALPGQLRAGTLVSLLGLGLYSIELPPASAAMVTF